uniref:ARAD1B10978p n=1 Tax=Blastobotrys adeninivorans TaxID=409370 RepID=A0A060T5G0_BLAAD
MSSTNPRPRSRTGCFTCRKRKKRCDEVRPTCSACDRLHLSCVYPTPGLERKNRKRKRPADPADPRDAEDLRRGSISRRKSDESVSPIEPANVPLWGPPTPQPEDESPSSEEAIDEIPRHSSTSSDVSSTGSLALPVVTNGNIQQPSKLFDVDMALEAVSDAVTDAVARASPSASDILSFGLDSGVCDLGSALIPSSDADNCATGAGAGAAANGSSTSPFDNWDAYTIGLHLSPCPQPPQSWYSSFLDSEGAQLFEYFCSKLAPMICVSTDEANSFLNVFVPMAQNDRAVLDSLVAWAGFHKDRGIHQDTGHFYLNRAMQSVRAKPKRKADYTTLATMLLITSAEICAGDVTHWDKHLSLAASLIHLNGGIRSFVDDKALRWLAVNFAYHDLLASSACSRNTHFPSAEYDHVMKHGYGLDALTGCCQPLFKILAEISELAVKWQRVDDASLEKLRMVQVRVSALEQKLESCHPDPLDMISLSPEQLDLQLILFDTVKITARLHLRQSVLRLNAASLDMQCLVKQLNKNLELVLGTQVEGLAVFPLFVAGIHCVTTSDRELITKRIDDYYSRNLARNISRAKDLMEEVWSLDDHGSRHVDWYRIIQARGWDICFA